MEIRGALLAIIIALLIVMSAACGAALDTPDSDTVVEVYYHDTK